MTDLLVGKRALVTGGGRNLGREYCHEFARQGAKVGVLDRDEESVKAVAEELRSHGADAVELVCDVTDEVAVGRAIDTMVTELGGIDVLVNNAAIYAGLKQAPLDQLDLDEWDRVMSVNVKGVLICARATAARMENGGSIVNISSTTGLTGPPVLMHYAASKGAVLTLTKSLARALAPQGIRVNAVAPGLVWDDSSIDSMASPEAGQRVVQAQLIQRPAQPEDITGAVLFLASDLSRWVTGQTIAVNGGQFLH